MNENDDIGVGLIVRLDGLSGWTDCPVGRIVRLVGLSGWTDFRAVGRFSRKVFANCRFSNSQCSLFVGRVLEDGTIASYKPSHRDSLNLEVFK